MSSSHAILRYVRLIHLYFGVFITPALLFFAFTGALQTFSLHETTRGSNYKPPAWAVTLGQIHKKQTPIVTKRPEPAAQAKPKSPDSKPHDSMSQDAKPQDHKPRSAEDNPANAATTPSAPPARTHNPLPLKVFFLIVAMGLFTSTLTGLYMSYKYVRNTPLVSALLVAGVVIPVLMIVL